MGNDTLAASAYADPLGFAVKNPYGTPARQAIARAQDEAQVSKVIRLRRKLTFFVSALSSLWEHVSAQWP
jgi:hypothetical protein